MRAGDLTETIIIQRQTNSTDANGSMVATWNDLYTLRATYDARGGARNTDQLETWGGESATFTIYYKPKIKATDRVKFGTSIYNIIGEPIHRRVENMTIINASLTRYE